MTPKQFVDKWQNAAGREIANSQSFLMELCDLLGVDRPNPTVSDDSLNHYVFEKIVEFNNGDGSTSSGRVDLYRKNCFVLESKQGSERKSAEQAEALAEVVKNRRLLKGTAERGTEAWRQAMTKAFRQAKRYAEALPEWPPFLIVADVGYCLDVYADFSGTGKLYQPFPDPKTFRIPLNSLADSEVGDKTRAMLRAMWNDPHSLDPTKRAAKATRDLAAKLAELAKRLEAQTNDDGSRRHTPEGVAQFLMRCLFTMFAEDLQVGGLKKEDFRKFLEARRDDPSTLAPMLEALWSQMNSGGFSTVLARKISEFNGGLFADCRALPLNLDQLELLIEAARADWSDVEPAIFGTLLERALDPHERHKLGAHYTPRAYVERLVMPTIIEPLREEWEDTYAEAMALVAEGKKDEAQKTVREFHEKLCETRVLDPACGSGNFLYVSLELMKRLEGEVLNALKEFGEKQLPLLTIDPHQFLGIEVNPRAAAIADLVLWIGYLQWHFRTRGTDTLREPIIRKFHNIECRDAVLAWDSIEPVVDADGKPVTRWDGRTTKTHPVTGEEVPDESARVQELRYVNPRKAEWPKADYIVGNPPFVGNKRMRQALGDGYTKALREAWKSVPSSSDFVMYWWSMAADRVRYGKEHRFGFVTTNSITQTLNREVVEAFLTQNPVGSLVFAIADHPWVDATDGADVRIAMTVGVSGSSPGEVLVTSECETVDVSHKQMARRANRGKISARLRTGAAVDSCHVLLSNARLAFQGPIPVGEGFRIEAEDIEQAGFDPQSLPAVVRQYVIGRDLAQRAETRYIIDFFGLSLKEASVRYPSLLQKVVTDVKPHRDLNNSAKFRDEWWLWGRPRPEMRMALNAIPRFIATCRTARHRVFQFLPSEVMPDTKVIAIALASTWHLGVLSARPHVLFANVVGGSLGVGNDSTYNHAECFTKFAFPPATSPAASTISGLAERLDAHRKRQQELHPDLTMTGMYNVLEKLRSGEPLTKKEQVIHEQGLVSVLKQIHDDLDAAVFEAYGWPATLTDEEILERLVALNHERAEEEKRGLIRWLRPEFQNPDGGKKTQKRLDVESDEDDFEDKPAAKGKKAKTEKAAQKKPWPSKLADRIRLVRSVLTSARKPVTVTELASHFVRPKKDQVGEVLEVLLAVGQARVTEHGRFVA